MHFPFRFHLHGGLGTMDLENHTVASSMEGQPGRIRNTHAVPSLTKHAKQQECGSDLTQTRVASPNIPFTGCGVDQCRVTGFGNLRITGAAAYM